MKTMKIRKLTALCLMMVMSMMTLAPALTVANGTTTTNLTPNVNGGGTGDVAPIVKAKWEMYTGTQGNDELTAAGAQFKAPGVWDSTMDYTVCAVVSKPQDVTGDMHVYADIFYPTGIAIHDPNDGLNGQNHPNDTHWYKNDGSTDTGIVGTAGRPDCDPFKEQNELFPLEKMAGWNLICDSIYKNNNDLPAFFSDAYDYNINYDEICGGTGELLEDTAHVYCDDKTLKWEDPAGKYTVKVKARRGNGSYSDILENQFEYLPLTAFEKDFSSVSYGLVPESNAGDEHKIIHGDQTFTVGDGKPTIQNLGNTRLDMWIAQDDMGLGKTSGNWNVEYDARIGNNSSDWAIYSPFDFKGAGVPVWDPVGDREYTILDDILDLSETEKVDFSILVTKFPDPDVDYSGEMYLGATFAPFRTCCWSS